MGCVPGKRLRQTLSTEASVESLTEEQKELIRKTWKIIEARKTRVGINTFLRLFEKNPALKDMFEEFRDVDVEELKNTRALIGHTRRVLKAVENAVISLDDSDCFVAYLLELGRRHVDKSVKPSPSNFQELRSALLYVFQQTLDSQWTAETASAWELLLQFVVSTIIIGLQRPY